MVRSKDQYIIKIHYTETEDDIFEMRRRMATEYNQFVKDYILTLPISDEMKNEMYKKVTNAWMNTSNR